MKSTKHHLTILAAAAGIIAFGASAVAMAQALEFDDADVYAELNNTDRDLGFHALIDGDAWKRLSIEAPNGGGMLAVSVRGRLGRQGLTEFFFESDEPEFSELAPSRFFVRFPEGEYTIRGVTLDDEQVLSTDDFSHLMPAPAGDVMVNGVAAARNCDAPNLPEVTAPVTLSWTVPATSHPQIGTTNQPITIEQVQVALEDEVNEEFTGFVELPGDATEYTFSSDLTDQVTPGTWKFEILLVSDTGNRTAVESCFDVQ